MKPLKREGADAPGNEAAGIFAPGTACSAAVGSPEA
jgi:hypothetical protein